MEEPRKETIKERLDRLEIITKTICDKIYPVLTKDLKTLKEQLDQIQECQSKLTQDLKNIQSFFPEP